MFSIYHVCILALLILLLIIHIMLFLSTPPNIYTLPPPIQNWFLLHWYVCQLHHRRSGMDGNVTIAPQYNAELILVPVAKIAPPPSLVE